MWEWHCQMCFARFVCCSRIDEHQNMVLLLVLSVRFNSDEPDFIYSLFQFDLLPVFKIRWWIDDYDSNITNSVLAFPKRKIALACWHAVHLSNAIIPCCWRRYIYNNCLGNWTPHTYLLRLWFFFPPFLISLLFLAVFSMCSFVLLSEKAMLFKCGRLYLSSATVLGFQIIGLDMNEVNHINFLYC